ncbi:MAG: hypothetical protein CM1200mP40_14140 [Gammaproteobacteria bacterium]|nr:MAG: hypothetical protein CM1200mP40_14140 [Gammaproteobacteria bacterium]
MQSRHGFCYTLALLSYTHRLIIVAVKSFILSSSSIHETFATAKARSAADNDTTAAASDSTLQLSTLDLQQEIHQALEKNPMLELIEGSDEEESTLNEEDNTRALEKEISQPSQVSRTNKY